MKKNKIIYSFVVILIASISFTSCNSDDKTDDSVIVVNSGMADVSAVSQYFTINGVNSVNEGGAESVIEYSVNLQSPQPVDTYVNVSLVSGTATEEEDFEFDHQVLIPAYKTSGIGTVTILGDNEVEETESFVLKVGSEFDANIKVTATELSFEITDFGDLNLELAWDRDIPGFPFTLCEIGYDVDFLLNDSEGNDVTAFEAATGACPETMTLSLADLSDGEYTLIQYIYDDGTLSTAGITPAFDIPVTITYNRDNSDFTGTFVQDSADAVDSNFGSDPGWTTPIYVATIVIENGLFTISKNGQVVGTGRMSSKNKENRPAKNKINVQSKFFN